MFHFPDWLHTRPPSYLPQGRDTAGAEDSHQGQGDKSGQKSLSCSCCCWSPRELGLSQPQWRCFITLNLQQKGGVGQKRLGSRAHKLKQDFSFASRFPTADLGKDADLCWGHFPLLSASAGFNKCKTRLMKNGWKAFEMSTKVRRLKRPFARFSAFPRKGARIRKSAHRVTWLQTVLPTPLVRLAKPPSYLPVENLPVDQFNHTAYLADVLARLSVWNRPVVQSMYWVTLIEARICLCGEATCFDR